MTDRDALTRHYDHGDLLGSIERGIEILGKTPESVTLDDLAAVDEFHIGGRQASIAFLDQMGLAAGQRLLDIGCGLGGPARFVADHYDCLVTGIDLTAEYIEAGRVLCDWTGLADKVSLRQCSALDMPLADASFDHAYMMHVGMNIEDKAGLCSEIHRLLRPGGCFGIFDVMRIGPGDLIFPVPWSSLAETSFVRSAEAYKTALQAAGFTVTTERNRRDFALSFFERQKAKAAAAGGPPPLSLHLVMGERTSEKLGNLVANIIANRVAPIEIIARKAP
ncbi:class I SAM-dependent methyltransferase [Denitrobaculum tricleocarpae]|uniref:Class I SAM-dependent methyltransferase n=1 Tax=Denitrobaculum tricleocarpae TaxID=2591009 RepID=A0A545T245_9PROT|nr:class I SAM-dependent methyltransferase [Denitrobaculum tricleocarpae]TQV71294.1 class I SAM-dependent methyltransferase [Denitrobaculum tricleocarpae]